jgi:polar amino acid transport system permease protein
MSDSRTLWDFLPFLAAGVPVTLEVTALAMILAVLVSVVLACGRGANHLALRWPAAFVVETFRGTSALVQLFWAFYVLPFLGIEIPALVAGVLVLGLNEGSYLSEVVRAGFGAVSPGQREAALTLGLSRIYCFFRITLPQALPVMVPPFGNALIVMLKFSALVSLVTIQDLTGRADLVANTLGQSGPVYVVVLLIYFVLSLVLALSARMLERTVNRWAGREQRPWVGAATSRVPDWALGRAG